MSKTLQIAGQRFGRLYVLRYYEKNKHGKTLWECQCDCGNKYIGIGSQIVGGHTLSCGCFRKDKMSEIKATNRLSKTRILRKWSNMMARCYNPKTIGYEHYGGRGISVCEKWHDLTTFAAWAYSHGYEEKGPLTLDRIDVNGNYEPSNCRFVDMTTQSNNKTNNRRITFNGETKTLSEWAREYGIGYSTLKYRLNRGWDVKRAMEEKPR